MGALNKNWLTQGLIDFEYKKYLLLAYLQEVEAEFNHRKLYPVFSDVLFHYKNLVHLKQNKTLLFESFPKQLTGADFEKLTLMYAELVKDDAVMLELEQIMEYSIPIFKEYLEAGKGIYDEIEYNLTINPIGLFSINNDVGYLFFSIDHLKQARIYEYETTIFENSEEKYRGIHTRYLETVEKSISTTFESMKISLIKKYKKLSNPATFLVDAKINYPFEESILPVAKRMLVHYINTKMV